MKTFFSLVLSVCLLTGPILATEPSPVFVKKAVIVDRAYTLQLYGTFVQEEATPIYSPIAGVVKDIRCKRGERVSKGQVLFTVVRDDPGFTHQVRAIQAPFTGIVNSIATYTGGRISPQNPVMVMASFDPIYFYADVAEQDLSLVSLSQEVQIRLAYLPEPVPGQAVNILEVNPQTRMARLKIRVSNPQARISAGSEGKVIYTYKQGQSVVIPAEAVQAEKGRYYVWIKKGDQAFKQEVSIGELLDEGFECLANISPGDDIIYYGYLDLKPGDRVKTVELKDEF